jgi:hypothetical protein
VAEIPFWLRHFKPIRFLSLFWACLYNSIYGFALIDFVYMLFVKDKDDVLDVLIRLFSLLESGSVFRTTLVTEEESELLNLAEFIASLKGACCCCGFSILLK